jgi:hypothetical protein
MIGKTTDLYSPGVDSHGKGDYSPAAVEASPEQSKATIAGKLKLHCPSLYFSLSAWEWDQLDILVCRNQNHA